MTMQHVWEVSAGWELTVICCCAVLASKANGEVLN